MTVILCIDDRGGMLFMKRRLSRDRELTADIEKSVGDGILYISDFSESLFSDSNVSVMCVSNPLDSAGEGDFAFIENLKLENSLSKIKRIIIYKWNRKYPFDFSLDIVPTDHGFYLKESEDFKGYSHDKITKEIYEK
ncbi:MAG: ribonuclease Z [Clostridia bacterium]|nr:ribonuclease Z [Clostridia bacterium]